MITNAREPKPAASVNFSIKLKHKTRKGLNALLELKQRLLELQADPRTWMVTDELADCNELVDTVIMGTEVKVEDDDETS